MKPVDKLAQFIFENIEISKFGVISFTDIDNTSTFVRVSITIDYWIDYTLISYF